LVKNHLAPVAAELVSLYTTHTGPDTRKTIAQILGQSSSLLPEDFKTTAAHLNSCKHLRKSDIKWAQTQIGSDPQAAKLLEKLEKLRKDYKTSVEQTLDELAALAA
jgi:hypothetical protein